MLAATALLLLAGPAEAQRFTFERTIPASSATTLDVSTTRGKIDIRPGTGNEISIKGTVTVRVAFDAPANALELAKQLADHPEIEQGTNVVRLQPPSDSATRKATTVSYEITVPGGAAVAASSDSGAVSVTGIAGRLTVKTSSAEISLSRLGGETDVTTTSGAVDIAEAGAPVRVSTQSGALTLRRLGSALHARTQSGGLSATFTGPGDIDVETSSSAITLEGIEGGLTARSRSGRIIVTGAATKPWSVTTGSGADQGSDAVGEGLLRCGHDRLGLGGRGRVGRQRNQREAQRQRPGGRRRSARCALEPERIDLPDQSRPVRLGRQASRTAPTIRRTRSTVTPYTRCAANAEACVDTG